MATDIKVELSEEFAVRIVGCYRYLCSDKAEYVMSKQLLRAGTSIGANISEALFSESDSDFIHKLTIAQKEASETRYWIRLLNKTDYLSNELADSLNEDCTRILKVLTSIKKSMKAKENAFNP